MPLYNYRCPNDHLSVDRYKRRADDRDTHNETCTECGEQLVRGLSMGRGLTYFEEGRGRWIENIGPKPEYITSHGQWREALKRNGREWVGARYGEKDCWV
jgi:hypothetical protein